jgi:Iap family predicted aminopeptidase
VTTKTTLFDGSSAFACLSELADNIGPRLTGSEGEHKAAEYIRRHFKACGLRTRFQKFPVTTFENTTCSFSVKVRGKWKNITCEPLMPSKSTPVNGVEGKIYFAETGDPEYLSPAVRDKIVLVCGRIKPDDRPRFLSYKPKALVIIESRIRDKLSRSAAEIENLKTYGNLPTVVISHLDGFEIIRKKYAHARLVLRNKTTPSYSLNVIGEKKGTEFPEEIIAVCGHYDSHMGIPGASDNAGGTAIMMELARVLITNPSRRTLRFIAFAAEETGLYGSVYYAEQLLKKDKREKKQKAFNEKIHRTECEQHRLVFNLDVHGMLLGRNLVLYSGCADLGASVRLLSRELGVQMSVEGKPMSSDGTPLAAAGIPAVQFGRYGGAGMYGHTEQDNTAYLAPEALETAGRFSEIYLRRYVTECPVFPFPREIPEDQKKSINEYFKNSKLRNPADILS